MNLESLPVFLTLLGTAFLGSWHCAAMCGPIAASFHQRKNIWPYHLGRGLAYLMLAIFAGAIGQNFLLAPSLTTRIVTATLLSFVFLANLMPVLRQPAGEIPISFQTNIYRALARKNAGPFALGVATLFLPCGWLWTYVGAAASTGSIYGAILVLFILWLSSLAPLTLIQMYFRSSLKSSKAQNKWVPLALSVAGLYSIWSHFFYL